MHLTLALRARTRRTVVNAVSAALRFNDRHSGAAGLRPNCTNSTGSFRHRLLSQLALNKKRSIKDSFGSFVIPALAGIHVKAEMDSRLCGDESSEPVTIRVWTNRNY